LRRRQIGASVHFIPIPLHPVYASIAQLPGNRCPQALNLYRRLVSLPLYPVMTESQLHRVATAVKDIVAAHRQPLFSGVAVESADAVGNTIEE
jgi:dTDP-4-amino-4,6-dideoxygalactose transaminase